MYDSILVSQSLIDKLIEDSDVELEPFNGYYNFQTKDLDNSLTNFFIEADGSFVWEKQEYAYVKQKTDLIDERTLLRLSQEPISDPQMIPDTRTTYIDFYDLCANDKERMFVTFTAHVRNGRLVEPIVLKSVERTNLEEERANTKKSREQWLRAQDTWQWKLATFIIESRWRVRKFFKPLIMKLDNMEYNLREQAKAKFKYEE